MTLTYKSRAAVLIPLYKTSMTRSEEFSFKRTLAVLSKHDLYIVGPKNLSGYFSQLMSENEGRIKLKLFNESYFIGIESYNRLLKSKLFYQSFDEYDFILIAQTDALIISDCLNEWCDRGFSYVGAPLFHGFGNPSNPLSFIGVGNGGLSLRKVSDFIRVLSRPRYFPNILASDNSLNKSNFFRIGRLIKHYCILAYNFDPLKSRINEDLFWGILATHRCSFFSVPTPEEAALFSFEVAPHYLYEMTRKKLPFGCHAWERYNFDFWITALSPLGIELPSSE